MKKYIGILLVILSIYSCGPSKQDAANYYESIISKQDAIVTEIHGFTDLFDNAPVAKIDSVHKQILSHIDITIKDIESIKQLNKDDKLKPASITLLKNLKQLLLIDYASAIKLSTKNKDDIESGDDEIANTVLDKTEDKLIEYLNNFEAVQAQFSKEYDLNSQAK